MHAERVHAQAAIDVYGWRRMPLELNGLHVYEMCRDGLSEKM